MLGFLCSRQLARLSAAGVALRTLCEDAARRRAVAMARAAERAPLRRRRGQNIAVGRRKRGDADGAGESWCTVLRATERLLAPGTAVLTSASLSVGGGHSTTGGGHTAVLARPSPHDAAKQLWLFGSNSAGQCGAGAQGGGLDAYVGQHVPPVAMHVLRVPAAFGHAALGVRAVACGHDFTLVLCADGTTVLSLGGNDFGQRGLGWPNAEGTAAMRAPPGGRLMRVALPDLEDEADRGRVEGRVVALAAGHGSAMALLSDRTTLFEWGRLADGEHCALPRRFRPKLGGAHDGAEAIAEVCLAVSPECYAAAALTLTGKIFTWGSARGEHIGDSRALLGRDGSVNVPRLVALPAAAGARALSPRCIGVSLGATHGLACAADGRVYAWGGNVQGQCGRPRGMRIRHRVLATPALASSAAPGEGQLNACAVSAGYDFSSVSCADFAAFAWGSNLFGEAYPRSRRVAGALEAHEPMRLLEAGRLGQVVAVAGANTHSVALVRRPGTESSGELSVYVWGYQPLEDADRRQPYAHVASVYAHMCHAGCRMRAMARG